MTTHFLEFRQRIIYCLFFIIIIFLVLFYYSDIVYDLFAIPIRTQLPKGSSIIATQVTATFIVPIKLALNLSLIISMPYIIFNIWLFISPGLYNHERKFIFPFIIYSIFLFLIGLFFAFYIICPFALNFFMTCAPSNVMVMISINSYMDFMFTVILSAGFSFQIPIIIHFIIRSGVITKKELAEKRPYIIVFAFILGMLLTPPDVISQILLAIPICLLFEIGLFFSK